VLQAVLGVTLGSASGGALTGCGLGLTFATRRKWQCRRSWRFSYFRFEAP
jgi:hypothetical protein